MINKNCLEKVSEGLVNGEEDTETDIDKNQNEINEDEQIKWKSMVDNDINEERKIELANMCENMVGILYSLKQNGELNIAENHYLTELCNSIYEDNSDQFHEINNVLLNISSK